MLARLAFFLLLIVPPMALAADAPPGGKFILVKPPAKAAAHPPTVTAKLPQLAAASLAAPDASDCRMSCAQTHYLCRASDQGGDQCDSGWTQCVAACNSPNLAPPYSTPP